MDEFIFAGLTPYDRLVFAKTIQVGLESFGANQCWDAGQYANSIFEGFNTSKKTHLIYKNFDANKKFKIIRVPICIFVGFKTSCAQVTDAAFAAFSGGIGCFPMSRNGERGGR